MACSLLVPHVGGLAYGQIQRPSSTSESNKSASMWVHVAMTTERTDADCLRSRAMSYYFTDGSPGYRLPSSGRARSIVVERAGEPLAELSGVEDGHCTSGIGCC